MKDSLITLLNSLNPAGNDFAAANVIANQQIEQAGYSVNAQKINHNLLETLHGIGDIETNVATCLLYTSPSPRDRG